MQQEQTDESQPILLTAMEPHAPFPHKGHAQHAAVVAPRAADVVTHGTCPADVTPGDESCGAASKPEPDEKPPCMAVPFQSMAPGKQHAYTHHVSIMVSYVSTVNWRLVNP